MRTATPLGAWLFPSGGQLGDRWGAEAPAQTTATGEGEGGEGKVGDLALVLSILSSLVLIFRK